MSQKNSNHNPWKISQEFRDHLTLEEFKSNPWKISQEYHGNLILEEFNSHLNFQKEIEIPHYEPEI